MKGFLISPLLLAAALSAADDSTEAARKEEQRACIQCHSLRIMHRQRLSKAAWDKEIGKMIGWGAIVRDRQLLLDYLSSQYSDTMPVPPPEQLETAKKN